MKRGKPVGSNSLIEIFLICIIIIIIIILFAILLPPISFIRLDRFLMTETLRPHSKLIIISNRGLSIRVFVSINLQLLLCVVPSGAAPLHRVLLVETPVLGPLSPSQETPPLQVIIVLILDCILNYLWEVVGDSGAGLVSEGG
jgi:hypothetical protein